MIVELTTGGGGGGGGVSAAGTPSPMLKLAGSSSVGGSHLPSTSSSQSAGFSREVADTRAVNAITSMRRRIVVVIVSPGHWHTDVSTSS